MHADEHIDVQETETESEIDLEGNGPAASPAAGPNDGSYEEPTSVSKIPHETRNVQFKEKVEIVYKGKKMTFKMVDTPGIATKIDYEDFLKYKVKKRDAKKRAKEAIVCSSPLLPGTASLWAYFVLHSISFPRQGGRLA